MKAWFVHTKDDYIGFVVHADTPGKAKRMCAADLDCSHGDWVYVRTRRCKELDDKAVTLENMVDAGFDMTYEGEPIDDVTVLCDCDICKKG
jgi:hypothetical protein